jgi:hypothetical protein
VLNGYDIPKIYFHKFPKPKKIGKHSYSYAVIDGKQRLLSIWGFIDGAFPLNDSFEFQPDPNLQAGGLTYAELGRKYPKLKLRFDSYPLSIIAIETDDLDIIEDMFSRLNEAVPLSAAEKRNAYPGPLPKIIRRLTKETFFVGRLPFPNKRYRHLDLAAKFLLIEDLNKATDTKKVYLDAFVRGWQDKKAADGKKLGDSVGTVLHAMASCFVAQDVLLRSVGMVTLYYHLFRVAAQGGWANKINRSVLKKFEDARAKNRIAAEADITTANYELLEFDRMGQSPNDAFATTARLQVLLKQCFGRALPEGYGVIGKAA